MTPHYWLCKTCGVEMFDSEHVMEHRLTTGHIGATLVTNACPPGPGSTPAGRRRARELFEQTRQTRHRGHGASEGDPDL